METYLEKKARIRNTLLISFISGVLMGLFFLYFMNILLAAFLALSFGLFLGLMAYFFQTNKYLENQSTPENIHSSSILYSGGANHFLHKEGVGGRLFLLKDQLLFKSHKLNFQNHELRIPLDSILEVGLFNVVGFVPNGLIIRLRNGKSENFVVNNRAEWKNRIEEKLNPETRLFTSQDFA